MATAAKPKDEIRDTPLTDALSERYLAYALSTITARALPDVRDGLKPVQRRILFAMRGLGLDPQSGFKKCARVVGDVIGRYHPHGEQAVYDALVRLAQDFAHRYPLVEGQGNFGNVDGDNAAAMRYTESRMSQAAELLLDGLAEDAVDFRDNYDGEEREPVVLPAAFPNLLANGSTGIAVGMATSIPPHNVAEICDAALHLIKQPNARLDTLLQHIPGPDFPGGGILVEPSAQIGEAYRSGRGSFRLRAKWEREETGRGTYVVVVTQIPYQVQKSKLVERIAELLEAKKLPMLEDVRDEFAEDIRLVLEPKSRNVDAELLMESLFRHTELETRIGLNMNVLDAQGVPRVMSFIEVLRAFLDHQKDVLVRRARFKLGRIERRLHVLEGYLLVYDHLTEVIRIIREEDEPKARLMKRFKLSDEQAEAVLNMRLRALRKLEEQEIRTEHKTLTGEAKAIRALLKSEEAQWARVADDLKALKERFGPKTPLGQPPHAIRRSARAAPRSGRGHDRARAHHGGVFRQRLDSRAEGPCRDRCGCEIQGRRPRALLPACRDDGQASRARHERALLHFALRQVARRPRPWRAGEAHGRYGRERGHRGGCRPQAGREASRRFPWRLWLHRGRGRGRGAETLGQAGAQSSRPETRPRPSLR